MLELFSKIIRYSLIVIPFFHINLNNLNNTNNTEYVYNTYGKQELTEFKPVSIQIISDDIMNTSIMTEHSPFYTNPSLSLFFLFMVNLFYLAID